MFNEVVAAFRKFRDRTADAIERAATTAARHTREVGEQTVRASDTLQDTDLAMRPRVHATNLDDGTPRAVSGHDDTRRVRPPYQVSDGERRMRERRLYLPDDLEDPTDGVLMLPATDGSRSVYKPQSREFHMRAGIPHDPGSLTSREVAAYRLDRAFGFGRVPPTALGDGPFGRGSVQEFVPSSDSLPVHAYDPRQQQQMAVLDYVMGNSDRNVHNFRTTGDGGILAVDHELSFPNSPDPRWGIRSEFVTSHLGRALDPEVLRQVHAVHADDLPHMLGDLRLGEDAIRGAQNRLREIQETGMITGREWNGIIRAD